MPALLLPAKHRYNYTATMRVIVSDKDGESDFVDVPVEVSYAIFLLVHFQALKHNYYVWLINIFVHNQYTRTQPKSVTSMQNGLDSPFTLKVKFFTWQLLHSSTQTISISKMKEWLHERSDVSGKCVKLTFFKHNIVH